MAASLLDLIDGIPEQDQAAFRKMWEAESEHRWGLGARPAVVVVDMVRAFVEDAYPTGYEATGRPCAAAAARLLEAARPAGFPVFYTVTVRMTHEPEVGAWLQGRPGPLMFPFNGEPAAHEIVPELKPHAGDIVFAKAKPSAFFGTQLVSMLTYLRVDSLIVVGMTTSGCVRATVNDAFAYNYRVTVPIEAVADRSGISHRVELLDMGAKYADVVGLDVLLKEIAATRRGD
jgi:maleamate amidohydrolase